MGVLSCNLGFKQKQAIEKKATCEDQLQACGIAPDETLDMTNTASTILAKRGEGVNLTTKGQYMQALDMGTMMGQQVKTYVNALLNPPPPVPGQPNVGEAYNWTFENSANSFTKFSKAMDGDPRSTRVLSYLAAHKNVGANLNNEFFVILSDSAGDQRCTRGPLRMTWRQARNLGISAQPSALIPPEEFAGLTDQPARCEKLRLALRPIMGLNPLTEIPEECAVSPSTYPTNDATNHCMSGAGPDDRSVFPIGENEMADVNGQANYAALGAAIKSKVIRGNGLPPVDGTYGMQARLLRYFAADHANLSDFRQLNFGSGNPSANSVAVLKEKTDAWAEGRAAEVMARAIAIPCLAVIKLEKNPALKAKEAENYANRLNMSKDDMPQELNCIIVKYLSSK